MHRFCKILKLFWAYPKKVNLLHNPQKKSKQQISKIEASPSSSAGRKPRWGWTSDGAHGCWPLAAERRSLFAAVSCTALRSGVALCPRTIIGILTNREWFYWNTRMPTITKTNETFWYHLDGKGPYLTQKIHCPLKPIHNLEEYHHVGWEKKTFFDNLITKGKNVCQNFCLDLSLRRSRVAGLGRLSAGAKMTMKPFVKRVFTIFATNASFLRVISNFRI